MTVQDARTFFRELQLSPFELSVADRLLEEIRTRLTFLLNVGLEYLSLDRLASTLSGGEAQRIQLATSLGSSLVGTLYVLDEPSIGLHARDNQRLIEILKNLRDMGNTVLVVEHESAMMKAADRIIDLGPGAGEQGGQMMFSGTFPELLRSPNSLTGKYLKEELKIHVPTLRLVPNGQWLKIFGAREHNLKSVEVAIPLDMMTCITARQLRSTGRKPMAVGSGHGRSVSHWTDAAFKSGHLYKSIRCDSRSFCLHTRGGKPLLRSWAFLVQYSGWPL